MLDTNFAEIYNYAKKKAKSKYLKDVGKGFSGNLPALDVIIKNTEILSEVPLGIMEVPLKKIIGTYSSSRRNTFAKNFLPLPDESTEFANKWITLYETHIKEGISDPIKVYEYLNWFYVVEGNKRVSVLKYENAFSLSADVYRLIPKRDQNSILSNIYYEFLKFHKKTGLYTIWFSKEKSFTLLDKYLDLYEPEIKYEDNKYIYFLNKIYHVFQKVYKKNGGDKLKITTGDALLEYIKIYDIPKKIGMREKKQILCLLPELKLIADKEHIERQESPLKEHKKRNVFSTISTLVTPKKKLKAAFAYARTTKNSGWTYAHDLGRLHVENMLGKQIKTTVIDNVPENNEAYNALKQLAEDGHDLVFSTSPTFISATLKAALEYPKVKFMNCSGIHSYNKVTTYYGRIHEAKYLLGLIAGALTKTNIIGCCAKYPIAEEISAVNAFAIGARTVNPYVRIKIGWSRDLRTLEKIPEVPLQLEDDGADIISYDDLPVPGDTERRCGLYTCEGNQLALVIWHWGVFYNKLINNVLNGTWKMLFDVVDSEQKLLNFWWGIDSGIVDVFYSLTHVPRETQKLVDIMRKMIIRNQLHPFFGPIYDQTGYLRFAEQHKASHEEILGMDWFVNCIEGSVPRLSTEIGVNPISDMLNIHGIREIKKNNLST
jgi:basic membrane lipoprotein Med (substrate-binding protein (PBP1-ABC) superfamily)